MVEDRKGASNHTIYENFEMISWNGLVFGRGWEIILKCGRTDPLFCPNIQVKNFDYILIIPNFQSDHFEGEISWEDIEYGLSISLLLRHDLNYSFLDIRLLFH